MQMEDFVKKCQEIRWAECYNVINDLKKRIGLFPQHI